MSHIDSDVMQRDPASDALHALVHKYLTALNRQLDAAATLQAAPTRAIARKARHNLRASESAVAFTAAQLADLLHIADDTLPRMLETLESGAELEVIVAQLRSSSAADLQPSGDGLHELAL